MPVEPNEKLGREPAATVLSARDLSCSDQLKPCSFAPGLFPRPGRMLRMAWAPKLMRRVNGVVGAVRELKAASSSSMALSSIESEPLVDRLPRRRLKGVGMPVGEVPERPTVETDSLLRWSMAVAMGPGMVGAPEATELLRWNRLVKAAEVTDGRRLRDMSLGLLGSPVAVVGGKLE